MTKNDKKLDFCTF